MTTYKQLIATQKIMENHGNVSQAMREAGYSEATAKNPKNLTNSKGFKGIMESYGLTTELVVQALVEDIKIKKQDRKGELLLASKILGLTKNEHEEDSIFLTKDLKDLTEEELEELLSDARR